MNRIAWTSVLILGLVFQNGLAVCVHVHDGEGLGSQPHVHLDTHSHHHKHAHPHDDSDESHDPTETGGGHSDDAIYVANSKAVAQPKSDIDEYAMDVGAAPYPAERVQLSVCTALMQRFESRFMSIFDSRRPIYLKICALLN